MIKLCFKLGLRQFDVRIKHELEIYDGYSVFDLALKFGKLDLLKLLIDRMKTDQKIAALQEKLRGFKVQVVGE